MKTNRGFGLAPVLLSIAVAAGAAESSGSDVVPKELPFDIPYGSPVTLNQADTMLFAAVAEAKGRSWKHVCAVVDSGANLVAFKRMDGAQLASIDISVHKARVAAKFRRETKVFEERVQSGQLYTLSIDDVIAAKGGLPIVVDGKIIGAVGCAGGTSAQDEVVAKAALAAIKK
jgi:uncharacterized protein GlcG (DUF336 family)